MNISKDKSLLCFHLESIEAGGHELVDGDTYEMVGDNNASWDASISAIAGTALRHIQHLEYRLSRYSLDAGQADQRKVESDAMREALGFRKDADDVSASDLLQALARLKAEWQAEALENAVAACARIEKGQERLAWMHSETLADGEEVVGAEGIPYSNKALGAMHCADEIGRMVTELRRQAEGAES